MNEYSVMEWVLLGLGLVIIVLAILRNEGDRPRIEGYQPRPHNETWTYKTKTKYYKPSTDTPNQGSSGKKSNCCKECKGGCDERGG